MINNVTAIIKAFERPDAVINLYSSIRRFYPKLKIIIVDDSKKAMDSSIFDKNVEYIHTDFDIGLSAGRNLALSKVKTKYFLLLDDDFLFTSNTKLENMYELLESSKFDLISGNVYDFGNRKRRFAGGLEVKNKYLYVVVDKKKGQIGTYNQYDIVLNFFMANTHKIKEIKWDDDLKLGEHEDFFLRAKENNLIAGSMEDEVTIEHYPVRMANYDEYRKRVSEFFEIFFRKNNLKGRIVKDKLSLYAMKTMIKNIIKNNKFLYKTYKILLAKYKKFKGEELRNPSSYIPHMELYKKITSRNPENVDFKKLMKQINKVGLLISRDRAQSHHQNILPLFKGKEVYFENDIDFDKADIYFVVGVGQYSKNELERLYYLNTPCYVLEETFLKCVVPGSMSENKEIPMDLFRSVSYFIDSRGPHFYPGIKSSLEYLFNSDIEVAKTNITKSKKLIKKIVENKLSKYNCQPIKTPDLPNFNGKRILVVDQSYRDFSVSISGGVDENFEDMLNAAIRENPDAQIIVKTHVDKASRETYFSRFKLPENVVLYNEQINPTSIIEAVDKVYVYSSTMGFEALLCGKEVHVFGSPIYAGWGLTNDRRSFKLRRTRTRTLEELFYFIYIKSSVYINPETNELTDIDTAIDMLVKHREKYYEIS